MTRHCNIEEWKKKKELEIKKREKPDYVTIGTLHISHKLNSKLCILYAYYFIFVNYFIFIIHFRSSRPEVFLRQGVLKIYSKFTETHPCRSVISIKLLCNFIEISLQHGCSPVNLLYIFRTSFPKNTSGRLLLIFWL